MNIKLLRIKNLSLTFLDGYKILDDINFQINENTINLLVGKSGCGKSSLLMCLARVIPEPVEGNISGEIIFNNKNIEGKNAQEVSGEIAYMFQDPDSQLCTFTVEDEIAFGLENLNIPPEKMESIIDEKLALIGISKLKKRALNKLSGGEKQKVALASILALDPKLILMDEPTANLDPVSTLEIVDLVKMLKEDMGKTVVLIEHKVNEFINIIDNVIKLENNAIKQLKKSQFINEFNRINFFPKIENTTIQDEEILSVNNLCYSYDINNYVLNNINFSIKRGSITAIVGYNGAGKTTLLKILVGFLKPSEGEVILNKNNLQNLNPRQIGEFLGVVFQNPEHQFIKMTVEKELALSLELREENPDTIKQKTNTYLKTFDLQNNRELNPFLLSQGQKRRLSTASMMINGQPLLILDEPTYGQDLENLKELQLLFTKINNEGTTILIITHDIRLVSSCCDNIVYLDEGKIKYIGSDVDMIRNLFLEKRHSLGEKNEDYR